MLMATKRVFMSKPATGRKEPLSDSALQMVAARFRALGDPTRLKLVQLLFEGEKSVLELANLTQMSQANVSKHLSILADQGILARRKEGLFVHYRIADQTVYDMCALVCESLSDRFNRAQQEFTSTKIRQIRKQH
jgi:DNA-binding transcriptional ArsR family regulator